MKFKNKGCLFFGCLPTFIMFLLIPMIIIMIILGGINENKNYCGGSSVNAGGHIFDEDYVVTQGFGMSDFARSQIGKIYGSGGHAGIDLQPARFRDFGVEPANIYSVTEGEVYSTGYHSLAGNFVIVKMKNNKYACYFHLDSITTTTGDKIEKGHKIGVMGNTGASTGYHVHFEVRESPNVQAKKDSSIYLGSDKLNEGDVIRTSDKLDGNVSEKNKRCNETNSFDKELVGNDNHEKVFNFYKKQGFSSEAIAGIMGNFERESRHNPAISEIGNNIGFGLAQWSFERRTRLEEYARENNQDVSSLTVQLNFSIMEMQNMTFGSLSYEQFKQIKDVREATELFERYYERAGIVAINERISYAEQFYRKYR